MNKGLLVTFEGVDGCGKSTQAQLAYEYLVGRDIPVMLTREPGGNTIGEAIRDLLLSPAHSLMNAHCELFLYLAARAQHVRQVIKPALEKRIVVICDRFSDATVAYQGFGRGMSITMITHCDEIATGGCVPDRTYIFDLPVDKVLARLQKKGVTFDRMESNPADFYYRVREGYLALASAHQERVKVLQAERSIDELMEDICIDLEKLLF